MVVVVGAGTERGELAVGKRRGEMDMGLIEVVYIQGIMAGWNANTRVVGSRKVSS